MWASILFNESSTAYEWVLWRSSEVCSGWWLSYTCSHWERISLLVGSCGLRLAGCPSTKRHDHKSPFKKQYSIFSISCQSRSTKWEKNRTSLFKEQSLLRLLSQRKNFHLGLYAQRIESRMSWPDSGPTWKEQKTGRLRLQRHHFELRFCNCHFKICVTNIYNSGDGRSAR